MTASRTTSRTAAPTLLDRLHRGLARHAVCSPVLPEADRARVARRLAAAPRP
jgi:hypothetical protein